MIPFILQSDSHLVPSKATDLDSFVLEVKEALDANQLPDRPIHHLFSGNNEFHPTCAGEWLEFGVASGKNFPVCSLEHIIERMDGTVAIILWRG